MQISIKPIPVPHRHAYAAVKSMALLIILLNNSADLGDLVDPSALGACESNAQFRSFDGSAIAWGPRAVNS